MNFESQYDQYKQKFEVYFESYFQRMSDAIEKKNSLEFERIQSLSAFLNAQNKIDSQNATLHIESSKKLLESIKYSCFTKGKRFRPVLILSTYEMLGGNIADALPYAAAVEMIHTYSLIHDDLPCMDNDDYRRGQPTNHKVFGDAPALLAGDALLTLAFEVLSMEVKDPLVSQTLTQVLSSRAGYWGMISGQMTDLSSSQKDVPLETLLMVHRNKTSALIEACIAGAGVLKNLSKGQRLQDLEKLGLLMGLSFQIADDLMDYDDKKEKNNFVHVVGQKETKEILEKLTKECFTILKTFGPSEFLEQLVSYNTHRKT